MIDAAGFTEQDLERAVKAATVSFQCAYCQTILLNPQEGEIQKHFQIKHPEMTGH